MKQIVVHVLILSLVLPPFAFAANQNNPGRGSCPTCTQQPVPAPTNALDKNLETILTASSCPGVNPQDIPKRLTKCAGDFACNMMRTAFDVVTVGGFTFSQSLSKYMKGAEADAKKDKSCLDASQGSCATSVVTGILKDLWMNVEGLGSLAKMAFVDAPVAAAKGIWKKGKAYVTNTRKEASKDFNKLEDMTDKGATFIGTLSWDKVMQFRKDSIGFMKTLFSSLFDMAMDFMKKNFGCAKWSGAPHVSTCTEPYTDPACLNCSQQANMLCGALGIMITEGVLINFLFSKGAAVMKSTGATSKISKLMKGMVPARAGKATVKAAEATKATKVAEKAAAPAKATATKAAAPGMEDLFKLNPKKIPKISAADRTSYLKNYVAEVEDIKAYLPASMKTEQKEALAIQKLKELEKRGLKKDEIHKLYDEAAKGRSMGPVKPIDYTSIQTGYLDDLAPGKKNVTIRADISSRYGQQIDDLKSALKLEDEAFSKLPAKQQDDFLVHTIHQMENQGLADDVVKARVHKALNECGIPGT